MAGSGMVEARASAKFDIGAYWSERYRGGGSSGRGSYGRLADFKAEVVNGLFQRLGTRSVIELGCGDGNQLGLYKLPERYVGLDIAPEAVKLCRDRFGQSERMQFFTMQEFGTADKFDMAMSIDVIFHLVIDADFEKYMQALVGHPKRHLLIYSSNFDEITKDVHVRHRRFQTWLERNAPQWRLALNVPNRYPRRRFLRKHRSLSQFYLFERSSGRT
jgi:SAM-dependent methyltransferase